MNTFAPMLSRPQAEAILDVLDEHGMLQKPRPTDEAEILTASLMMIKHAVTAIEKGNSHPALPKIMAIANGELCDYVPDFVPEVEEAAHVQEPVLEDPSPSMPDAAEVLAETSPVEQGRFSDAPGDLLDVIGKARAEATSYIAKHRFPIPPELQEDIPDLPRDFSKLSLDEIRSHHAMRSNALDRVIYELGLEESDYEGAQVTHGRYYRAAFNRLQGGQVRESERAAKADPEVMVWEARIHEHHAKVMMLRGLKEIFENDVRALSRDASMRQSVTPKGA